MAELHVNFLHLVTPAHHVAQSAERRYRFALGTSVVTGAEALTCGFDLHPAWDMKFRWPAYLRQTLCESAPPAKSPKPGGRDHLYQKTLATFPHMLARPSTHESHRCAQLHSVSRQGKRGAHISTQLHVYGS